LLVNRFVSIIHLFWWGERPREPSKFDLPGGSPVVSPHHRIYYLKSTGFTPSMSSITWFSPAIPQMNL